MARPRKPTAHLELAGSFKKDPQRRRDHEPVSDEVAVSHPELSEGARKAYQFVVETAVPGVLQKMDSSYLALTCEALAKVWYPPEGQECKMADIVRAGAMVAKLGMTPTERSRVVVPKKEEENPYAKYKKA